MEVTHVLETITTSPKPSLSVASETRCSRGNAIRLEYTTGTLSALRSVDLMVTTPILKPITNIQERNANLVCQVKVIQTLYFLTAAEAAMELWQPEQVECKYACR